MKHKKKISLKLKNKFILKFRHIRGFIRYDKKKKKFIIHEKYKKSIKWGLRILFGIGILSSLVTLSPISGILLSLILAGVEQLLEKTIFMFHTLFIQPMPEWATIKKANWTANLFGVDTRDVNNRKFLIGLVFENEKEGKNIFEHIQAWNYNLEEDSENNIEISLIIESPEEYSTYIYPSNNRSVIKKFNRLNRSKKDNVCMQHIFTVILCKQFPGDEKSYFYKFKKDYKKGEEYVFKAFTMKNGNFYPIENTLDIRKKHIKIKKREKLTKKDLEFEHGKFKMNK